MIEVKPGSLVVRFELPPPPDELDPSQLKGSARRHYDRLIREAEQRRADAIAAFLGGQSMTEIAAYFDTTIEAVEQLIRDRLRSTL